MTGEGPSESCVVPESATVNSVGVIGYALRGEKFPGLIRAVGTARKRRRCFVAEIKLEGEGA